MRKINAYQEKFNMPLKEFSKTTRIMVSTPKSKITVWYENGMKNVNDSLHKYNRHKIYWKPDNVGYIFIFCKPLPMTISKLQGSTSSSGNFLYEGDAIPTKSGRPGRVQYWLEILQQCTASRTCQTLGDEAR